MDADWRFLVDANSKLKNPVPIVNWRVIRDDANGISDESKYSGVSVDTSTSNWRDIDTGADPYGGGPGYAWYRTTLPAFTTPHRVIHFVTVDDDGDVYLNGVHLLHHSGWDSEFDVPLDKAWNADGPNILSVLVHNIDGGGGITGPVTLGNESANSVGEITPTSDDSSWRIVHLPHDYVIEQPFTEGLPANHGSLPTPKAWYRKTFTVPITDKGKSIWLDFDGVYRDAIVYLNGTKIGEHQSGYTPARYDLTTNPALKFGVKNDLAVYVDPTIKEGWFYEGGGIYRHVWLNIADPVHVAPWGTYVVSTIPAGQDVSKPKSANIKITTTVRNDSATAGTYILDSAIFAPSGDFVAEKLTRIVLPAESTTDIHQRLIVNSPKLWSTVNPNMYSLHTDIAIKPSLLLLALSAKMINQSMRRHQPLPDLKFLDTLMDQHKTPFGIRTIRFDKDQGFFLNGRHVEIDGVCNHQDFAGVGSGMPDSVMEWRTRRLKEMGCNAFRTSHNMVASEILDDCDRDGILVMDENRHLGDTYEAKSSPGTGYSDLSDLAEMVQRDRNHPSVIIWSMCNEEGMQGTPEAATIFKAMMAKTRQFDTTRPISCAMNGDIGKGITLVEDIQGINYQTEKYDSFHAAFPNMPVYGSEIGSILGARGVYQTDYEAGLIGIGADGPERTWGPIITRPFMTGGFDWTGFDYKGEPTPYSWPDINSNFGLMDMCGFPKDYYYYFKAKWEPNKPLVHIFPYWNYSGQEGKTITIHCYSNAPKVELFLNGVSLGIKDNPLVEHPHWDVPYAPGTLTAKGYNESGATVATDTERTTGTPAGLKIRCENPSIKANGEDVSMIEVSVVDSDGDVVPSASNTVTFTATNGAQVVGTGNGDPADHTPDHSPVRNAFNGYILGIVGATDKPGTITVTASSPGLTSAHIAIQCSAR